VISGRVLLLCIACAPTTLASALAYAQTPAPPAAPAPSDADTRAVAEMLFFTGRGLMDAGRIAEACQKFAESYRLDPAAGTLLNLAVCHEKEGRIASAWGEFRQAIAEARRANRPDREELAQAEIAKVQDDLPFLTISVPVSARVPGLKIERNGVPLNDAAWDTELPLDPGTNEIRATAPRYKPQQKTIAIQKREHLTIVLDPMELAPVEKGPPPFWTPQRQLGAAVLGGGVALAAVGGFFGGVALSNRSKSDQNCPTLDGQLRCSQTGVDAMKTAQTDAWIADVGVGIGAVAVVTGLVLMITGHAPDGGPPTGEQHRSGWGWGITTGPGGAGGVLRGSF
jgi:hypothetical protein